jgi:hypothetical protein
LLKISISERNAFMKIAPYLAAGALTLALGAAPAMAAGTVSPAAAKPLAATGAENTTLTLVADRDDRRRHRGKRGNRRHQGQHRRNRGEHRRGEHRRHRGDRRRGHRRDHRRHRGEHRRHRREHRREWRGHGRSWRDHRQHRRHDGKRWRRHVRRDRFHRGRFHDKYWRSGPTFGFWFGYPLYYYGHLGYDCHRVTIRDYWRGHYALIGGTLCYDELGYPYLYRRWLIRYLY